MQGRVEGWDAMKPRYCRSVNSNGAGRPRLMHHHKGWWNEMKWMKWVWRNGGMKFVVGENGINPEKNLPSPRFVHHETHMEWPRCELGTPAVGGNRLTACVMRLLGAIITPWKFHGVSNVQVCSNPECLCRMWSTALWHTPTSAPNSCTVHRRSASNREVRSWTVLFSMWDCPVWRLSWTASLLSLNALTHCAIVWYDNSASPHA